MGLVQDLRGTIQEGVLTSLLQYLALNQAGGCLTMQGGDTLYGTVYLDRGRLVHAATARSKGVAAIAEMIAWREGQFRFRGGEQSPEVSIQQPLEHVLLEASHQVDEAQRSGVGPAVALNAQSLLRRREFGDQVGAIQIPANAIPLLAAMDGERPLGVLAQKLGLTGPAIVAVAQELLRLGLAEAETPRPRVPEAFATELLQLTVRIVGPVGEIIVEDALDDLNLNPQALSPDVVPILLREVNNQLKNDQQRQAFQTASRALRSKYRC